MAAVAVSAGVSQMTVSLALRNHPSIPEETRLRIRKAADKLGYRPHPLVSALMATRRKKLTGGSRATVGFLTYFPTKWGWREVSPSYSALYDGLKKRADELGYAIEHVWLREPGMTPKRLTQILETRGINGLVLSPIPSNQPAQLPEIEWNRFSVLAVGYSLRTPDFHRVSHDYFHAMISALKHCRDKGYRKIGFFIDRNVTRVVFNLWLAAYLAEQNTTPGISPVPPLLLDGIDPTAITKWIRTYRPEIVVGLDATKLPRKIKLPASCALIDLNADESTNAVAGISRDFHGIGIAAFDRMIALLHANEKGPPVRPHTLLVEGQWVNGEKLPSA